MTDHITFFQSYYEAAEDLPAEDFKEIMSAVFRYVFYGEEPETLSPSVKGLFILMRPNLDMSMQKADSGSTGGKRKAGTKQTPSRTEAEAKQTPSDKEKEKEKEKGIGQEKGVGEENKKKRPTGAKKSAHKVRFPGDEALEKAFDDFAEMRKRIRAPMTEEAADLTISELNKLSGGDHDLAIRILQQSVQRSWRGIFPLKDADNKPRGKPPDRGVYDEWEEAAKELERKRNQNDSV